MLWLDLVMCKSHSGGTGFERMKRSWRAAEALHCERPWKAIGESASLVAISAPDLTVVSWRCQCLEMTTKNSSGSGEQAAGA